ncbi:MAG: pyridoxamine 5'-phosphate oxidase family protein [Planctomycetota bacterium]
MRRTEKEITDRQEIDAIIHGSAVCRLGLARDNIPYVVPVSFGYDGEALYFHTALTGKKIDYFAANDTVCFELERNVALVPDAKEACRWTFAFESVIGYGHVSEIITEEEKASALQQIMSHYSDREWMLDAERVASTRVWRITIEQVTGKRSHIKPRA